MYKRRINVIIVIIYIAPLNLSHSVLIFMGVFRVQNRSVPIQSATLIIGPILEQWL